MDTEMVDVKIAGAQEAECRIPARLVPELADPLMVNGEFVIVTGSILVIGNEEVFVGVTVGTIPPGEGN